MKTTTSTLVLVLASLLPDVVVAAPLDALLRADAPVRGTVQLTAAYDAMDDTLDVFNLRSSDPVYGGTNVGDYTGQHLLAGYAISNRFWVDAGYWSRHIHYHSNVETVRTWQVGGQYRLIGEPGDKTALALRLSAWGDGSGDLAKTTPTTISGVTVGGVDVINPHDRQLQADLLAAWRVSPSWSWGGLLGVGSSTVSVNDLQAEVGGCRFGLAFDASGVSGNLLAPCNGLLSASFSKSTSYDLSHTLSYRATYAHAGVNGQWQWRQLTLSGGYLFETLNRQGVDHLISTNLGQSTYRRNQILQGEAAWAFNPHYVVFVQGLAMSNQFAGEIPFAYNAVTVSKFSSKYGLVSFGGRVTY